MMSRHSLYYFVIAILVLSLTGCVQESSDGAGRIFTYQLWVPLSVLLVGVAGGVGGWFLREQSARIGWGLLIMGPLAAVFFAPSLLRDRAVVNDNKFSVRTGIWGLTAVHEVKLANLKQVRIISEQVRGRRGSKRTNYYLLCEGSDGATSKVPVNNAVSEAAAPHFLKRVADLGIPILDET